MQGTIGWFDYHMKAIGLWCWDDMQSISIDVFLNLSLFRPEEQLAQA